MTTQKQDFSMQVAGSIYIVSQSLFTYSAPPGPKQVFSLVVHNRSGDWVDVNIDRNGGVARTGHIPNGADGGFTEPIQDYLFSGASGLKLTRWRPGVFGVPGNGGGDITFSLQDKAESAILEITING